METSPMEVFEINPSLGSGSAIVNADDNDKVAFDDEPHQPFFKNPSSASEYPGQSSWLGFGCQLENDEGVVIACGRILASVPDDVVLMTF